MIISTAADHITRTSISARSRLIFLFFALVSAAAALLVFKYPNAETDWDLAYEILLPVGVLSCMAMAIKPSIGDGSLYLVPLFMASTIRVIDLWQNYFQGDLNLEEATRGAIGWSFLMISIAYVDLLESRIYHRMVNYIEQEVD